MPQAMADRLQAFLGFDREIGDVSTIQMALRTVLIYAVTLALIRLGSKRFLGEATAFDVILGFMLGSVMSTAVNSSAPLVPTLAAGAVFVGLHWLLSTLAFHTDWFGAVAKGNPVLLIEDGRVRRPGVRRAGLSARDLDQALRLRAKDMDPARIERAYLERNGRVSVIPRASAPCVSGVSVADGVQTVRITRP